MGLFNRKKKQDDDSNGSGEAKKEKGAWRRPASKLSAVSRPARCSPVSAQTLPSSSSGSRHGSPFSPQRPFYLRSSSLVSYLPPSEASSSGARLSYQKLPLTTPTARNSLLPPPLPPISWRCPPTSFRIACARLTKRQSQRPRNTHSSTTLAIRLSAPLMSSNVSWNSTSPPNSMDPSCFITSSQTSSRTTGATSRA